MKVAITIAFILAAFVASPASAEPRNDTPHALACMKKYGFTYAGEDKNPVSGIAVNRMAWRP